MTLRQIALVAGFALCLAGCASNSPKVGNNVAYGDPGAVEGLTNEFGSTDLQMIAQSMTNSLLQNSVLAGNARPIVTVADVRNKTDEYIDTTSITDKIRTQLLKSGKVRFATDIKDMQGQVDELQRQNQSGLYNRATTSKIGNMQAAKYRLEGSIGSIVKRADSVKDVYYLFDLKLVDNETGLDEWADEKEIRKTSGG